MILHAILFSGLLTYLLTAVNQALPFYQLTSSESDIIYGVIGITVLFGGIFVDRFVQKPHLYEILSCIGIISMILMQFAPIPFIGLCAGILLAICSFLMAIIFFTLMISNTTLLNRGRSLAVIIFIMLLCTAPLILSISSLSIFDWAWLPLAFLLALFIFVNRKTQHKGTIGQIKTTEKNTLMVFFRSLFESNTIGFFSFLFLTSATLGFFMYSTFETISSAEGLLVAVIVGLISFPLIGTFLDNWGRKPIVMLVLFAVCTLSLFYNYPSQIIFSENVDLIRLGVFLFAGIFVVILTTVLAGDKASLFSRGRITGLFFFATASGIILGAQIEKNFFTIAGVVNQELLIQSSDWITLFLVLAIIAISQATEPFEPHTPKWRDYLRRIYVIHKTGIGLFAKYFQENGNDHENLNENLVSGGLTGLESMIKEISESHNQIQILDHGEHENYFSPWQIFRCRVICRQTWWYFGKNLLDFMIYLNCKIKRYSPDFMGMFPNLLI